RREDPHPVVGARTGRREHESGLREVHPAGKPLHLAVGEASAVEHHGQRVTEIRRGAEDIDLAEGTLHNKRVCHARQPRIAPPAGWSSLVTGWPVSSLAVRLRLLDEQRDEAGARWDLLPPVEPAPRPARI